MAKNFTITDPTPLYDKKILFFKADGLAGITQTGLTRIYEGVPDTQREFRRFDNSELSASDFEDGDVIHVQYNAANTTYYLMELRAQKATMSETVSNGFSVAGYIVDNDDAATDNTEDFEIPTGLRVGFGGSGSSERILVKSGIETGQAGSKLKVFQIPRAFPWEGGPTVIGDTLNDTDHGGYFGFGSELQVYQKDSGVLLGVPKYTSESSVTGSGIVFDGQYTILDGTSQSEMDVGDIRLIDLIDDDLVTVVGRYRAELVVVGVFPSEKWNWRVEGNITDLIVSANYTAGVIPSFNNSYSIGNNAYITDQDQLVLGTTGLAGEIITDYNITTTGTLSVQSAAGVTTDLFQVWDDTVKVNWVDSAGVTRINDGFSVAYDNGGDRAWIDMNTTESGSAVVIGWNDAAGKIVTFTDGEMLMNTGALATLKKTTVNNDVITDVPLKVTGMAGTTADLFQVYDDTLKAFWIDSAGKMWSEYGMDIGQNGGGTVECDANHVNLKWDGTTILQVEDGGVQFLAGNSLSVLGGPSQLTNTGSTDALSVNQSSGTGNVVEFLRAGGAKFTIDQNGYIIVDIPTSSAGLPTGALWSNSGVVTVA